MAHEILVARQRAYALLGGVIRHGVRERDLPAIGTVPTLAECLSVPADLTEIAAAHHGLFQLDVPPYESFFLQPDRLLGGTTTDSVSVAYRLGGFVPDTSDVAADHLGVELTYLSWLGGARADAAEDGEASQDRRIEELERVFLDQHLLRWLPILEAAIPDRGGLFGRVLELALTLAREHRASIAGSPAPWELPQAPDLDAPETRLRDIAEALCTPCHAGGLLTRTALAEIGRRDRLPQGFGDRTQTLANLFRSGARFGVLDQVLSRIDERFQAFESTAARGAPGEPWEARARLTRDRLKGMRTRLSELADT